MLGFLFYIMNGPRDTSHGRERLHHPFQINKNLPIDQALQLLHRIYLQKLTNSLIANPIFLSNNRH